MTNSPLPETARSPANSVIEAPIGKFGISFLAEFIISSIPVRVTAVSSLFSISCALGPINVLPCVVVQISIPLDFLLGVGKTTPLTKLAAAVLSKRIYSPRRG